MVASENSTGKGKGWELNVDPLMELSHTGPECSEQRVQVENLEETQEQRALRRRLRSSVRRQRHRFRWVKICASQVGLLA